MTVQSYFAGRCIGVYPRESINKTDLGIALFICAAAVVASNETFEITPARTYGIFLAILTFTTAVNIWGNKILGKWNDAARESTQIHAVIGSPRLIITKYIGPFWVSSSSASFSSLCLRKLTLNLSSQTFRTRLDGQMECPGCWGSYSQPSLS